MEWELQLTYETFSGISLAAMFSNLTIAPLEELLYPSNSDGCYVNQRMRVNIIMADEVMFVIYDEELNPTVELVFGGDGSYTYQWYTSPDQLTWTAVSGANLSSYQRRDLID